MLLIQHALFVFFFLLCFPFRCNVQSSRNTPSGRSSGKSSRIACSYNPKVSSIYGTKWTVCANRISCTHTHSIISFCIPAHQKAIEQHFNEGNSWLPPFFVLSTKIREHGEISVMLGAKRVHALFSALRPYIKIQMRTLSMNMHKLVVRYGTNTTMHAAPSSRLVLLLQLLLIMMPQ